MRLAGNPVALRQARELRGQGYTHKELARVLGVSKSTCNRNLLGVNRNRERDERIRELVLAGMRLDEIAGSLPVSRRTVARVSKRLGLWGIRRAARDERIIACIRSGMTWAATQNALGVSGTTVARALKGLGL